MTTAATDPPETQIMANGNRCTVHPQHVMVNEGRSEMLNADVWRCACGEWDIGSTDETRERAAHRDC